MSTGNSRGLGMVLTVGLIGAALTFLVVVLDESRSFDNPMPLVVIVAGALIFGGLVRSPIGRAIARMLEDDALPDEQLAMRVEDLEARVAELSMEQSRVMELEGRIDFAERMIAGGASRGGTDGTTH